MSETATTGVDVTQSVSIAAPRERVFELLTDPEQVRLWMPLTKLEPHVGGRMEFVSGRGEWHAFGEVTEIDPPRVIAYSWDWHNQPIGVPTEVRFELEESGGATVVRLTHAGLPSAEQREQHAHGWEHYAKRLREVGEGRDPGPDTMGEEM